MNNKLSKGKIAIATPHNEAVFISFYFHSGHPELYATYLKIFEKIFGDLDYSGSDSGLDEFTDYHQLKGHNIKSAFISHFVPLLAQDAMAFQLILTADKSTENFFLAIIKTLQFALIERLAEDEESFLGCTIVYQVGIKENNQQFYTEKTFVIKEIISTLPQTTLQYNEAGYYLIKTFHLPVKGSLYLLKLPSLVDKSMIYLAMDFTDSERNSEGESSMTYEYFGGEEAILQQMDIFIHKALLQWNFYKAIANDYEDNLRKLNHRTEVILYSITERRMTGIPLDKLASSFALFKSISWKIERMYFSIAQQIHGIERIFEGDHSSSIAQFHVKHLSFTEQELGALLSKSETAINTTRLAIEITEGEHEKQRTIIIAIVGVILTLDQIITDDLIRFLIKKIPAIGFSKEEVINVFLLKLILAVAVGVILFKIFRLFRYINFKSVVSKV